MLRQLPRRLRCELQRALCESHLWLSLWERPPRSPFTRLQRATCCAVLLQLFILANTLWYSIVVDRRYRYVIVSLLCVLRVLFFRHLTPPPVLQPSSTRVQVFLVGWRDGGSRRGDLPDRLPSLPARLHALQNEPQQGNTNLTGPVKQSRFLVSPSGLTGCLNVPLCV